MWNCKCSSCGHDAYVGLFGHINDCSNPACSFHKPIEQTTDEDEEDLKESIESLTITPSSNPVNITQASSAPPVHSSAIIDQKMFACYIANFLDYYKNLHKSKNGAAPVVNSTWGTLGPMNLLSPAPSPKYIYENFILAGGAPRNWNLKRLANDLDFFFDFDKFDLANLEYELRGQFLSVEKIERKNNSKYGFDTIDVKIKNKIPVQLIAFNKYYYNDPSQVMNTFDFNINKVYVEFHGGSMSEHYTLDYNNELSNKTLTFNLTTMLANGQYSSLKKIPDRIKKFQGYFPDHTLVVV